jgi:hypothetical protein
MFPFFKSTWGRGWVTTRSKTGNRRRARPSARSGAVREPVWVWAEDALTVLVYWADRQLELQTADACCRLNTRLICFVIFFRAMGWQDVYSLVRFPS